MDFTASEYVDMLMLAALNNYSARGIARNYAELYPDRKHPDKNVILRLIRRSRETGQLMPNYRDAGRPTSTRTVNLEEEILHEIGEDPERSTRSIARDIGPDHMSVHRVLRTEKMKPYKFTDVQELLPDDYARRVDFCRWLLQKVDEDHQFVNNILFSDESMFDKNGVVNRRNTHFWSVENPLLVRERRSQRRWSVNLWGGIVGSHLIGPVIIPDRQTGQSYADFLREDLPDLLEDLPLEMRRRMWYQHDGAGPHNARVAKAVLNTTFPGAWIGRGGPVEWPARSPDLNPLDFFLWGYLKEAVYNRRNLLVDPDDLASRLDVSITSITPEMVGSVQAELIRRARACIFMEGGHFEHIYGRLH